tara:strand:+ start:65 stop:310 length:246 start_codon:yes stop_codon:yes gene_type:complete
MIKTYVDKYGYLRYEGSDKLVHRTIAKVHIWAPNCEKYPLPFREYEVHHKDGDKLNNKISNLEVLTNEEHALRHGFHFRYP